MIVKKIKSSRIKAKASSIRDLTDYIREPEHAQSNEKVLYANGRGFICDDPKSQQAEMIALASESVRSKNPVAHYVMSWREGEQPSPQQVESAVSTFLDELGLKAHQAIYALHQDTDNSHLHMAINRVHPDTLKIVEINKGFDIEAAHKAIARIEHEQGWQREQRGRYQVLKNGDLGREHLNPELDKPRQPGQRKRDMENRTGEKSAERIAIEEGAPIIKRAASWPELHQALAEKGMRYEKTGSGATLFVGDVGVKASSVDRNASWSKLQTRLGVYEPPSPPRQRVAARAPEPVKKDVPGWNTYITGRQDHYKAKGAATLAQKQQHEAERKQLAEQQRKHREEVLQGSWKDRGALRNALQSVVAAEQASAKAELKEQHQKERDQVRQQYRPYPSLEQWHRLQKNPELAEQWRFREGEQQRMLGDRTEPATPRDIRAYVPEIRGNQVHYLRKADVQLQGKEAAFVDKGREIDVRDWRQPDTVLAALQLSAQKWGSFKITGNDEFKAVCVQLAAEHGFRISNPELQGRIEHEREAIAQRRSMAQRPVKKVEVVLVKALDQGRSR
jgi:Relaxase/Mobilisation nuclease domain/Large polyvalent protein-associated domain 7